MDLIIRKALKVILTKRFVIIRQSQNFKRIYDDEQFRCKTISSLGCYYSCPNVVFFLYSIPSSNYSKGGFVFLTF